MKNNLNTLGTFWDEYEQFVGCNKIVDLPAPKAKDKQINTEMLDATVVSGELDYLCHSKNSVPSIDHPVNGACVFTAAIKWTYDEGLLLVINAEFKHFGLPTVLKLDNARVRIIVSMWSHALIWGCDY